MTVILVLLILMGIMLLAPLIWYGTRIRKEISQTGTPNKTLQFKFLYILAPVIVFFISQVFAVIYYQRINPQVGYIFRDDGTPAAYVSRLGLLSWEIIIQIILIGIGWFLVTNVIKISNRIGQVPDFMDKFLMFMGNIVVLPQLILVLAVADIVSYNIVREHQLPVWTIVIGVLGFGAVAFGVIVALIIIRQRKQRKA